MNPLEGGLGLDHIVAMTNSAELAAPRGEASHLERRWQKATDCDT
jgi:hypothetical protein